VLAPLGVIDFWFVAEQRRVHKTVHHFLLEAVGGELSDDDIEVVEVEWVPLPEVAGRLAYADERRLVAQAQELLAGDGPAATATADLPEPRGAEPGDPA
jgi:8-oxo-dGTP pyrophosphatase MutT (NUDIX family)